MTDSGQLEAASVSTDSPRRAGRSSAALTTLDQLLSSASNALLLFALAHVATAAEFGVAALLVGIVSTVIGFNRGALGTPILLVSNMDRRSIIAESGYALTWAAMSGIAAAVFLYGIGLWTGAPILGAAFAVVIPGVLVQDALRFTAIAQGKPLHAVVADTIWAAITLALFIVCAAGLTVSLNIAVLIWGASGAASGALLVVLTSVWPRVSRLLSWWKHYSKARIRFGTVQAMNATSATLVTLAVTTLVGATEAGGLRGASTLFGPIAMLISALPLVFVPHARRSNASNREQWRLLVKTSIVTSATTLVCTAALMVLPSQAGRLLLGDIWEPAEAIVPYMGLSAAAGCWMMAIYSLFQSLGLSKTSFRMRTFQIVLQIGTCIAAAVLFATTASIAISLALSSALSVSIGLTFVFRELRRAEAGHGPAGHTPDVNKLN